jgi:AcrR family transcriptional regulator
MTAESKETLVEEYRRETILSATTKVIARKGLSGATMQEIADEARIAKGTIYLYYQSREELVEKAADHAFSELLERSRRALEEARTLPEQLRQLVRTQFAFFDENQQFFRVYMLVRYGDDCAAEARRRRRSRLQYQRYLELLGTFLQAAMQRGAVKPGDPQLLASFLAEGMSAILMRRIEGNGDAPPADRESDWIVDVLLDGMAVRGQA